MIIDIQSLYFLSLSITNGVFLTPLYGAHAPLAVAGCRYVLVGSCLVPSGFLLGSWWVPGGFCPLVQFSSFNETVAYALDLIIQAIVFPVMNDLIILTKEKQLSVMIVSISCFLSGNGVCLASSPCHFAETLIMNNYFFFLAFFCFCLFVCLLLFLQSVL